MRELDKIEFIQRYVLSSASTVSDLDGRTTAIQGIAAWEEIEKYRQKGVKDVLAKVETTAP